MNDDYKNHPKSIGEIKSNNLDDGGYWTPRECLIAMLRDIDNGLDVKTLIICLKYNDSAENKNRFRFSQSTKSNIESVGILEHCKVMMIVD